MKYFMILCVIFLFLAGCTEKTQREPYLACIEKYNVSIDTQDSSEVMDLQSPPKPVYLDCSKTNVPFAPFTPNSMGLSPMTTRFKTNSRSFVSRSVGDCNKINEKRKRAYEAALERYIQLKESLKQAEDTNSIPH